MGRILIVIKVVLIALPFFAIGYFLHDFYRFTPEWLHAVVIGSVLLLGLYFIYKNRKGFFDKKDEKNIPDLFHGSSYFYLIVGAVLGFVFSQSVFKTTLYIDNGRDTAISVLINNRNILNVEPHMSSQMTVPVAALDISVDGISKTFLITEKGKWIYNIDSLNTYIKTSIKYSDEVLLTKEGSKDSTETSIPGFELIDSEFFNADVDYVFNAPETISIKKRNSGKEVEKTVLYRLGDDEK